MAVRGPGSRGSTVVALVVAGADVPGALAPVGGLPMVVRAIRALLAADVTRVVLLVPDGLGADFERACSAVPVSVRALDAARPEPVWRALFGDEAHGRERSDPRAGDGSAAMASPDVAVVHDADRPLAPAALVAGVVAAARAGHPVVIPVLPLTDTVKIVDDGGRLRGTPDRSTLRVAQTPFALHADLLDGRLRGLTGGVLDLVRECAAWDVPVHTVPGHPMAFPLRSAWDLELAGLLLDLGTVAR